jgi:hypothetical protein
LQGFDIDIARMVAKGGLEPMQVFYNTCLAAVWDSTQEQTKAEVL